MCEEALYKGLALFAAWILIVNIIKIVLRFMERRTNLTRQTLDVVILGYDYDTAPPLIHAETLTGKKVSMCDYDNMFMNTALFSVGKRAHIVFANRYTGIIWLQMSQMIYSIDIMD